MALANGSADSKIRCRMDIIRPYAMAPPSTGDTTQLATIRVILSQLTASGPMPTAPKPTIAPTMVWVVDTGQPRVDATSSHRPAASRDASITYTSTSGVSVSEEASRMPLRIVFVTCPPARNAPANSKIAAMTTA